MYCDFWSAAVEANLHVKVSVVDECRVAVHKVLHIVPLRTHEIVKHAVVHSTTLAVEAQVPDMDGLPCCLKLHIDSIVVFLWRIFTSAGVIEIWASHGFSNY